MTLTEFLLARISEDEAAARDRGVLTDGHSCTAYHGAPDDPFRWLAECEAKRRIIRLHGDAGESQGYVESGYGWMDHACLACGTFDEYGEPWPCKTLRSLALPYMTHPDFREEWRYYR